MEIALGKPQAIIPKDDEDDMEDDQIHNRSKKNLFSADGNNTSKRISDIYI